MTVEPTQYLTFVLGAEEYGIDVLQVQEIRGYTTITAIPNQPTHVRGVMNLRGTVVPVIDLRARFGMPAIDYTKFNVIILVNLAARVVGMVVDAVSDVLDLTGSKLETPPQLGASLDTSFMTGIARSGERLITMLQVDRALGIADTETL